MTMISIITPCFNEEEALPIFHREAASVLDALDVDYELLFVNDGSHDKTLDELRDEITRQTEERVNLIKNGQLNEETAADGRIWESNIFGKSLKRLPSNTQQRLLCARKISYNTGQYIIKRE